MEWLNIHISTLRTPEFIGSNPAERATWLCVLAYSVEQENTGRIVGGATWKDRQWQQTCGVTLREVRAADKLIAVDGDDVVVNGYPVAKERKVVANRGTALAGAMAKWGRGGGQSPEEHKKTRSQRLAEARQKGTHTKEEWQEMVDHFKGCVRCKATDCPLVKDHIVPIYQGGSDAIQNLQPLCATCNASKGPESTDWRPIWPAGCLRKWLPEMPAGGRRSAPAEGKGIGREQEGKGNDRALPPVPIAGITTWIRTSTSSHERTQENQQALVGLIQRFGAPNVQRISEQLAFARGGKIWPDDQDLLVKLIASMTPKAAAIEQLPDDLNELPDGHPMKPRPRRSLTPIPFPATLATTEERTVQA